jgi:hypothetical protein
MLQSILDRLPPTAKSERETIATSFQIVDNLKIKADAIRADRDLSDVGKATRIRDLAAGSPLGHFRQLRSQAAGMVADVANLRKALEPKAPEDQSPTAEMKRAELRAFVRSLPSQGERLRFVQENEAATVAVMDSLPALSGLSTEIFDQVKQGYVERLHGSRLAGIEQRAELADQVSAALQIASRQFAEVAGMTEDEIK